MKTWTDYKEYVKGTAKEARKDIEEAEKQAKIVSGRIRQCNSTETSRQDSPTPL